MLITQGLTSMVNMSNDSGLHLWLTTWIPLIAPVLTALVAVGGILIARCTAWRTMREKYKLERYDRIMTDLPDSFNGMRELFGIDEKRKTNDELLAEVRGSTQALKSRFELSYTPKKLYIQAMGWLETITIFWTQGEDIQYRTLKKEMSKLFQGVVDEFNIARKEVSGWTNAIIRTNEGKKRSSRKQVAGS